MSKEYEKEINGLEEKIRDLENSLEVSKKEKLKYHKALEEYILFFETTIHHSSFIN